MGKPDMDMMKQVRKALADIRESMMNVNTAQAIYQLDLLRKMIDTPPNRQQPWSHYQPLTDEEFGD
jgi:hypothetical protein